MSLALKKSVVMRMIFDYELDKVAAIEKKSYPEGEAASREAIAHCEKSAPTAFLAALKMNDDNPEHATLIGYICGSLSTAGRLTHESMHTHQPEGEVYVIHSVSRPLTDKLELALRELTFIHQVCVDPAYQRNGIGKWMLEVHGQQWLPVLLPHVKSRSLICKQEQIGFFQSAGFELVGASEIKRGKRQWYEMSQAVQRR